MTKLLLLSLLISSSHLSISQSEECVKTIHEGIFITTDKSNGDYHIERKENSQIEYFNGDKSKIISKVEWISPLEYTITVVKQVKVPKEMKNSPKEFTFKVIECNGEYHTLENTFRGETISFEMRRINQSND